MSYSFLLCSPEFFTVEYEINPYMDTANPVDVDRAIEQWSAWKQTLEATGASISVQDGVPGLPDIVFTNNAGFVVNGRALLPRFKNAERRPETAHDRTTFERLGLEVVELSDAVESFEGAAEAVVFGDRVVCGWGQRTSESAAPEIARFTGLRELPVRLIDPRFYHLDVVFCPLDEHSALIVENAMGREDLARLTELVPDPIMLNDEEAMAFCANSIVIDRTIFMNEVPARVERELAQRGFEAHEQPAGEFLKAGGSIRCMTLRLDQSVRVPA